MRLFIREGKNKTPVPNGGLNFVIGVGGLYHLTFCLGSDDCRRCGKNLRRIPEILANIAFLKGFLLALNPPDK